MKSALSEPTLLKMLFSFMCATSYWLTQIALHIELSNNQIYAPMDSVEIEMPITNLHMVVPDTLK